MARHIFHRFLTTLFFMLLFSVFIAGCGSDEYAKVPVTEAWRQPLLVPVIYVVQPGDSLYSIAWMYGLDYRQIAQDNHINAPYHVRVGQKLRLRPQTWTMTNASAGSAAAAPATAPAAVTAQQPVKANAQSDNNSKTATPAKSNTVGSAPVATPVKTAAPVGATNKVANIVWSWPAQGKVTNGYDPNSLSRGIDIAGKTGDPVVAAANGKVVYSGNGLRGYGQLIIIKHNDDYLSAYAHNQTLLVKEGQSVRLGQQIATVGATEATSPGLHFEIRLNGKPVDPLKYLPAR